MNRNPVVHGTTSLLRYPTMIMLRWWFLVCCSLAAFGMSYNYGLIDMLVQVDKSYLSFVCLAIYFAATVQIGWSSQRLVRCVKNKALPRNDVLVGLPFLSGLPQVLKELGFCGTLVGFMLMLSSVDIGVLSAITVADTQKAIGSMMSGMFTAISTTLVGLITSMLLKM